MQGSNRLTEITRSALIALIAIVLSLQGCELLARRYLRPPLGDRIEILDPADNLGGDCYPRARGVQMPLDISKDEDAISFFGRLGRATASWPDIENGKSLMEDLLPMPLSYFRLIREAPLCIVYDLTPKSPRRIFTPSRYEKTYAVLGDSFAFGQGVRDEETFTTRLANLTHARIRSYAAKGANIPEILAQFDQAMKDSKALGVSKIIYVYVLNDPYIASDLNERINVINDLMNVRISAADVDENRIVRFAGWWSRRSAIVRALLRAYSTRRITHETIRFYNDAQNPALNYGLIDTFDKITGMRDKARAKGIDFVVLVYPMMLDMHNYPLAPAHWNLADLARKKGIALHDMLPAFERHAGENITVHPIDMHPNGTAQKIAAEDAAAFLMALPPISEPSPDTRAKPRRTKR